MPLPESTQFDINQTNTLEPSNTVISDGFEAGDKPPASWINWLLNRQGLWNEATRTLFQSRALNWRLVHGFGVSGAVNLIGNVLDAKYLSNGQELVVVQDYDAVNAPGATDDDLRVVLLDHGWEFSAGTQYLDTTISIAPNSTGGRNHYPFVAEDGVNVAMPTPWIGSPGQSLIYAPLPITTGSTWTAANISASTTRQIIAVHYSAVHSLWIAIEESNDAIWTATTVTGTWTQRQALSADMSGAHIAESADGTLVLLVRKTTDGHEFWRSTDGITWSSVTDFGSSATWQALLYDAHHGLFWTFLASQIWYSSTGETGTWTQESSFDLGTIVSSPRSVAVDQYGTLVMMGDSIAPTTGMVLAVSVDAAVTWTRVGVPTLIDQATTQSMFVSFTGQRFIAGFRYDDDTGSGQPAIQLLATDSIFDLTSGQDGAGAQIPEATGEIDPEELMLETVWMVNTNTGTPTGDSIGSCIVANTGSVNPSASATTPVEAVFSTGTNANGQAGWYTANSQFRVGGGVEWRLKTRVRFEDLSDGTNTYKYQFGFIINGTQPPGLTNACILLEYQHDLNGGNFQLRTRATNNDNTDTGIVVAADTDYVLELVCNAAGTQVDAYIDGVLVGTNTTEIPTATDLGICFNGDKNAGTTARLYYVPYIRIRGAY